MKRRILIALTSVGLLVGVAAAPALAAPYGPDRYQITTNTYTMALGYGHTYTVIINPCGDGSVTASGWQWGPGGDPAIHNPDETITATLSTDGTMLTFDPAVYVGGWGGAPYSWSGTFPVAGGTITVTDSLGGVYANVAITPTSTTPTTFKNHGEYVADAGGGADAAHACIGMPIVPADEAAEGVGPGMAALAVHLEAVVAKLVANAKANDHAITAIQRHVDALNAGDVPAKAKAAKPAKPDLPAKARGNPNPGNPGKP